MKFKVLFIAFLILALSSLNAQMHGGGQGKGQGLRHQSAVDIGGENVSNLYAFLSLPDEKLLELEQSIRRIREMPPEERLQLKKRIEEYHQLPQPKRQALYQAWGRLNPEIQKAWRSYMQGLGTKEKEALHEILDQLPHDERIQMRIGILKDKGLMPKEQ
jgi:hypothetical protein